MKCNIKQLGGSGFARIWLVAWLGLLSLTFVTSGCRPAATPPGARGPGLPVDRIAIVGASVSAGFGGTPFGDAFRAAAKGAAVESWANLMLFRDPVGETRLQLGKALEHRTTSLVALDLLFWHVYNSNSLDVALAELDKVHATGAWIVIGDVPRITTASELLLPKEAIPSQEAIDAANTRIRSWAARERVLLVPLAEWTAPLRAGANIEIAPGEQLPAASLMAVDGLHANPLGTWYLLDRLDKLIETALPGTPKDALVFVRPR
jgi:hypothetical protein